MPESRKRKKRKVERPPTKKSRWSRSWRYIDIPAGCLPMVAVFVATPIALLL